ncbi:MAG: tetratricopeptide repeat protein [Pseudomonadota bacterium]
MYPEKILKALQRARSFIQAGNPALALHDLEKAVQKFPGGFEAWFLLGHAKGMLGDHAYAEICFNKAAAIQPKNPDVWFNLGIGYAARGMYQEAIPCFEKSIAYSGQRKIEAYHNLGSCLLTLDRFDEAAKVFQNLLSIRNTADIQASLGIAYQGSEDFPKAISAYMQAKEMGMDDYTVNLNIGTCHFMLNDFQRSIQYSEYALALKPGDPVAEYNIARSFLEQGDISRSIALLKQCALPAAEHARLFALNFIEPYDPAVLLEEHRNWANRQQPTSAFQQEIPVDRRAARPLRLGFVSADLRHHPVAFFLERLIENIDRSNFSVHFYSDVRSPDEVTERFKKLCDGWNDISGIADNAKVARLINEQHMDILFDLGGHTSDRIALFVNRIAPVQASYLGYSATTGLPEMDYFITDAVLDPVGSTESHYTEKLCRLGNAFATYTPPLHDIRIGPLPLLKNGCPVFGSFHKLTKISRRTISLWASVLSALPDAKMLLVAKGLGTESGRQRIQDAFLSQGIAGSRLDLRGSIPIEQYFAAHNEIDLLLDCFPWNSHTTAMHGLWMGVPTLTVAGKHHAGRFGELILRGLHMDQFISPDDDEFPRAAAGLLADTKQLQLIRSSSRDMLNKSILCDHAGLASRFQRACRQMWSNCLAGKAESVSV